MSIIFFSLAWPGLVYAQADARQAKIAAATANALSVMAADLSRQPITTDISVGDLVTRLNGGDALQGTLNQAEQIGGPRWIDEQTCQIRLEIAGPKVADCLEKMSDEAGEKSPLRPKAIRTALHGWEHRSFSAIGSNIAPMAAGDQAPPTTQPARAALPAVAPAWAGQLIQADGNSRHAASQLRAARAAESEAMTGLRQKAMALPIDGKTTLGDAAANDPHLQETINRAVQRAKLTKVNYQADGGASVEITLDLADLWQEINADRP